MKNGEIKMDGGLLVGNSHATGGIKIQTPEGQIEAEGGEVIVNKRALALDEEYVCAGTPKDITSKINELEGGISWSDNGSCRVVKKAADGSEISGENAPGDKDAKWGMGFFGKKAIGQSSVGDVNVSEVKEKLRQMNSEWENLRTEYKYGGVSQEEYLKHKKELLARYKPYVDKATSLGISVNPGILVMATAQRGDVVTSKSNPASAPRIRFGAYRIYSLTNSDYPEWEGTEPEIKKYIDEVKESITDYNPDNPWEENLEKLGLTYSDVKIGDVTELAARGSILRSQDAANRPSPSVSATIYPVGFQAEGNDGNIWEVSRSSNGIYRWVKLKVAEDGAIEPLNGRSNAQLSQKAENGADIDDEDDYDELSEGDIEEAAEFAVNSIKILAQKHNGTYNYTVNKDGQKTLSFNFPTEQDKINFTKELSDLHESTLSYANGGKVGNEINFYKPKVNKQTESIRFVNTEETQRAIDLLVKNGISRDHITVYGTYDTNIKFINNHTFKQALGLLHFKAADGVSISSSCGCTHAEKGAEIRFYNPIVNKEKETIRFVNTAETKKAIDHLIKNGISRDHITVYGTHDTNMKFVNSYTYKKAVDLLNIKVAADGISIEEGYQNIINQMNTDLIKGNLSFIRTLVSKIPAEKLAEYLAVEVSDETDSDDLIQHVINRIIEDLENQEYNGVKKLLGYIDTTVIEETIPQFKKGGGVGQDIIEDLKNFDVSQLDPLETRMYNDFIKHSSKQEALQILINNVEGDYSQLSPELEQIAKKQSPIDRAAKGKSIMTVTTISDIPNLQEKVDAGEVTYRGLGVGKLYDDFYNIAGEPGTRIKVDGKEYFITDTDFRKLNWDFKNERWLNKIKFSAPYRKAENGASIDEEDADKYGTIDISEWENYNKLYKDKIRFAPYAIPDSVAVFEGKEQASKKFFKMYGSTDHIKKAFDHIESTKNMAKIITDAGDAEKYPELVKPRNLEVVALTPESYEEGYYAYEKGGPVPANDGSGYEIALSAAPNPDFAPESYEATINLPEKRVKVKDISEAKDTVIQFIADNDLGSGNWTGGQIYKDGKPIAFVSYNGRVWEGKVGSSSYKEFEY